MVRRPRDCRDIPRDEASRGERAIRVPLVLPAKRHGPSPDAIDSNQVVENRAKEWHEKNEPHPTNRRANFILEQERVDARYDGEHRDHPRACENEMRGDPINHGKSL